MASKPARTDRMAFDSWDRAVLRALIILGVVISVGYALVRPAWDWARGNPLRVPYSGEVNVTRLRLIAFAIVLGWSTAGVTAAFVTLPILGATDIGDLPLVSTWMMPVLPLGIGMVVALLAEAFKIGAELRDDVDGLV